MTLIKSKFLKYKGFLHTKNNISLLAQFFSITKENIRLTDAEKAKMSNAIVDYLLNVGNLKRYPENIDNILVRDIFTPSTGHIYKYINEQVYNDFISKGIFRLGSIKYYQAVENDRIKDEFEGFTNLFLDYINRELMVTLFSGYNFAIFCGTSNYNSNSNNSEDMKNKFGRIILKISDPIEFGNIIKETLRAKSYYCYEIKYSARKIFSIDFGNERFDHTFKDKYEITPELFDIFYNNSFFPSLFIKPEFFSDEKEIRIAFEMDRDIDDPIDIENKDLLKYIEILNL